MNDTSTQETSIKRHANGATETIKERVENARDIVENIRDKA